MKFLLSATRCSLGFCLGRTTVQARSVLKPEAAERPQPLSQAGAGGNLRFTPITTPQNRCRIFARHHSPSLASEDKLQARMKAFVKVLRVSTFATCMKMRRLTDVVYHSGLDDFKYRATISVRENMGCLCFLETLSLCRSPSKVLLLASAAWRTMAVSNQVPQ